MYVEAQQVNCAWSLVVSLLLGSAPPISAASSECWPLFIICLEILQCVLWFLSVISVAGDYDPCVDNEVEIYFNRPEVQKAMHANTTGMPGPWVDCNSNIAYSM